MHGGYLVLWAFAESVGAGSCDGRLVGGIGGGAVGESCVWRVRYGYGWEHTVSFGVVRDGGAEANGGPGVDSRDYSVSRVARPLRSDGSDCRRCALMLGQMAGYDPLDIFSVQSTPVDYVKEMHQPVKGFRLGTPVSFYDHVEPEIEKAVRAALEVLIGMTAGVTSSAPLWDGLPGYGVGDTDFYHHDLIEKYGLNYMPIDRARFARIDNPPAGSKPATAADAARDHQMLANTRRMIDSHFDGFDLVVVPTTRLNPAKINDSLAREAKAGPTGEGSPGTTKSTIGLRRAVAALIRRRSMPMGFPRFRCPADLLRQGCRSG